MKIPSFKTLSANIDQDFMALNNVMHDAAPASQVRFDSEGFEVALLLTDPSETILSLAVNADADTKKLSYSLGTFEKGVHTPLTQLEQHEGRYLLKVIKHELSEHPDYERYASLVALNIDEVRDAFQGLRKTLAPRESLSFEQVI